MLRDFARCLQGVSFAIFVIGGILSYCYALLPQWWHILNFIILWYFNIFGVSRFTPEYRKIF